MIDHYWRPDGNKQNHWRRKPEVTIMVISVCFSWAFNFNTASVCISLCSELHWVA